MKKKKAVAGGAGKGGATGTATADLLVCFPARQHLALMPKPICSPSRATLDKAVAARRRQLAAAAAGGRARGSPLFRGSAKAKQTVEEEEEPQSPKVTCAGQIKVGRPKKARVAAARSGKEDDGGGGRSWLTVVEEIERLRDQRKKVSWLEAVGIRRDALPFLGGVLRSLRLKTRCFGSLNGAVDSSTEDDDGGGGEAGEQEAESTTAGSSATVSVFSKWLMVLEGTEEPQEQDSGDDSEEEGDHPSKEATDECSSPAAPPPNALLLMRCRSAPAKGLARRTVEEPPAGGDEEGTGRADAAAGDDDGAEDRDELVFMSTAPDFLKLSLDIAKETWVVGGIDPLARSRSWKR